MSYEGPINRQVTWRITVKIYDYDGDINNYQWSSPNVLSSIDRDVRERTNGMLNSKLVFDLGEAGKPMVSGGWARDKQHPTTGLLIDNPQFPRNAFNPIPNLNTETSNVTAKNEQDLEFAHFTSISGVEHYDTNMTADIIDGFLGAAQNNCRPYFF